MTDEGHILDVPLPLNQDFNALKEQGLAYIQMHSDYRWTNLNASDPGVTILDQLCYALTELGYCNDFPLRDILARKDSKIQIYDQFYLPEHILTTSPVTVADYTKFVIDAVTNVENAVFLGNSSTTDLVRIYNTFLLINSSVSAEKSEDEKKSPQDYVCDAAFVYLNAARNLCELFAIPLVLQPDPYTLTGQIAIESTDELATILQLINESVSNYIFAPVIPRSYKQLLAGTETMDSIFDGPRLKNGWISTDMLNAKKDDITIYEIIQLIEGIPGVISVDQLHFSGYLNKLHCEEKQLIVINANISYTNKSLVFVCNNTPIDPATFKLVSTNTQNAPAFESNILFGAGIDIRTDLPKATYRDINTYYSIQNTFPDIYPVGPEFVDSNATDFQIAQSRQLMGYLTLFDQVLANQFSQLANVEQLFSFRNAMTATPSDKRWYYAVKDHYHFKTSMYPVPYLRFSPTYFFQSMYDVPGIKPVLKGNETFDFHLRPLSEDKAEKIEWHRFRLDPYNPYMRELMNIIEDEAESLRRRNEMLNHLLARHGESSLLINAYIDGSSYTNEEAKDKVIFKSLYLQNLGLLSYNRYKAYNYLQADPFEKKHKEKQFLQSHSTKAIRQQFRDWILTPMTLSNEKNLREVVNDHSPYYSERLMQWILTGDTVDSVFDSEKVDALEKIHTDEFRNYAGIELKLNLLLGLKALYRNLIITGAKEDTSVNPPVVVPEYSNGVKLQALQLISRRKGFIMIEMSLLQQCLQLDLLFGDGNTSWQCNTPLSYNEAVALTKIMSTNSSMSDSVQFYPTFSQLKVKTETYSMQEISPASEAVIAFQPINGTGFSFALRVSGTNITLAQMNVLANGPLFIFPDYVPMFRTYAFYARIQLLLENELPVNTQPGLHYSSYDLLKQILPAFIKWHDSLVYDSLENYQLTNSSVEAAALLSLINETQLLPYSAA